MKVPAVDVEKLPTEVALIREAFTTAGSRDPVGRELRNGGRGTLAVTDSVAHERLHVQVTVSNFGQ
jgi:hypothetical protein